MNHNRTHHGSKTIKVFNTDLYLGGQDVVVEDAVNGNVFAFGATVTIKGEILGDVFVLAQSLTLEDTAIVHGNIFSLSKDAVIKGKINYDIYSLGQNFELAESSYVNRDIKLFTGIAKLYGSVKKDAFLFSGNILMAENAKDVIGGDLHYTSDKEFSFPKDAVIGNVKYTEYKEHTLTAREIILGYVKKFISTIIYTIIIILVTTFFTPKFIEKANHALTKRPFVSAGIGILAIVLIPVVALLLLFTGWLSSLSIATIAIYALILSITLAIFSMAIAKSIADKWKITSKGKFILFAILTASVLWILQLIPVLGTYVSLFISVVGLGIFLFSFFRRKEIDN